MKAVILAGGRGTRLFPLTQNVPKPLLPVMGRPLLDLMVERLSAQGFDELVVTTGHYCSPLLRYLEDHDYRPARVYCAIEESPLGTAGSVRNAESLLHETFVVVSGDLLTDADIGPAIKFHESRRSLLTILMAQVWDVRDYGLLATDRDGRVLEFREKPRAPDEVISHTANAGIYIMEPEVLGMIPHSRHFDFARELIPRMLASNLPVYGCPLDGYWSDLGSLRAYHQSHIDILEGRVEIPSIRLDENSPLPVPIDATAEIRGPVSIAPGAVICAGARVGPFTVVGTMSEIGEGSQVEQSIINPGAIIGSESRIRGSIIGDGTRVARGSNIVSSALQGHALVGMPPSDTQEPAAPPLGARDPRDVALLRA